MKKANLVVGVVLTLAVGSARAGISLNQVGAILIYPGVAASRIVAGADIETFLTITNTSTASVNAHVAFIDGDAASSRYCGECDFDVFLTGLDTEVLVMTSSGLGFTDIVNLDTGATRSCHGSVGFVVVDVEDVNHNVLTDNILLGSEIVVDYLAGSAYSVPAIPNEGILGDGNRTFEFDDAEYSTFPSVVGTDFLAPDFGGGLDANLVLFTLAFDRRFPPLTDCSVTGFDAFEAQFSGSIQFGCWTVVALGDINPEFYYPFLGGITVDEHGWLQLACTVFGTGEKNESVSGGVHGAFTQFAAPGTVLRRQSAGPALANAAGWARLLFQSGTNGELMVLYLTDPARGGTF